MQSRCGYYLVSYPHCVPQMTLNFQNWLPNIRPSSFIMDCSPSVSRLSASLKVSTNTLTYIRSSFRKSTSCSMLASSSSRLGGINIHQI